MTKMFVGLNRFFHDRYRVTRAEAQALGPRSVSRADAHDCVAIEAVEDPYYALFFCELVRRLQSIHSCQAHQFIPRSLRPGSTRSLLSCVKGFLYYNSLTDRKWERLYNSFCDRVAYRSSRSTSVTGAWREWFQARAIWKSLDSTEALLDLNVEGVTVGDLVYDTYLRFKPAATVELRDRYLWVVLWQTLRDLHSARSYFSSQKPTLFITTYSTYIQHGIAVRVALMSGVKVFAFGNLQETCKQLSLSDWAHTRYPDEYRMVFRELKEPERKLEMARANLAARLAGGIDSATAYMRRSAYAERGELPAGLPGSLVLFLHDFFDSPHCYRWMVFADFWEWATFTLDLATEAKIPIFVKPHPNQIAVSTAVVEKLKSRYPSATWLSANTSNAQLAEVGIACGLSVYGTVCHELAYLGVPSISVGHNPHVAFSFCHTATSKAEYRQLVLNFRNLARPVAEMRRESLEFYCAHNLALAADEAALRDLMVRHRGVLAGHTTLNETQELEDFRHALANAPGFRLLCENLASQFGDSESTKSPTGIRRDAAVSALGV